MIIYQISVFQRYSSDVGIRREKNRLFYILWSGGGVEPVVIVYVTETSLTDWFDYDRSTKKSITSPVRRYKHMIRVLMNIIYIVGRELLVE